MKMTDNKEIKVAVYCRYARESERKTALYCRTAQQSDLGIESQKNRLSRFAEINSYKNTSWYIDDGESGLTLDRPAMMRLIADIAAGGVQTVLITGADRIARGIEPMSEWLRLLEKTDARCIAVDMGGQDICNEFAFLNKVLYGLSAINTKA